MKTLKVWRISQTEAPIFAVFAVQPENSVEFSAGKKELMVDGLPADIGIGVVLPSCSPPLATSLPVLLCTGVAPVAL